MEGLIAIVLFLVIAGAGLALYFVPFIIAYKTDHPHKVGIFVLNFLLGATVLGWVGALVWAVTRPQPQTLVVQQPMLERGQPSGSIGESAQQAVERERTMRHRNAMMRARKGSTGSVRRPFQGVD